MRIDSNTDGKYFLGDALGLIAIGEINDYVGCVNAGRSVDQMTSSSVRIGASFIVRYYTGH